MLKKPATVVIAAKAGRLGNRLFLSAYFMANALAKGYGLLNPALGEYAIHFEGSEHDPFCRFPAGDSHADAEFSSQCREVITELASLAGTVGNALNLPEVRQLDIRNSHDAEDRNYDLCDALFDNVIHSSRYLVVKGWKFRDDKNLVRFHSEISRYFKPVSSIRHPAEAVLKKAREAGNHIVGVHLRHGDYRGWKNGVHYFETEQYAHWMKELVKLMPDKKLAFVICANDSIDQSYFEGLPTLNGPGSVEADLHTLSLCDAIMGPPSTFSTWASYHGRVPLCMLQHAGQKILSEDFVLHDKV